MSNRKDHDLWEQMEPEFERLTRQFETAERLVERGKYDLITTDVFDKITPLDVALMQASAQKCEAISLWMQSREFMDPEIKRRLRNQATQHNAAAESSLRKYLLDNNVGETGDADEWLDVRGLSRQMAVARDNLSFSIPQGLETATRAFFDAFLPDLDPQDRDGVLSRMRKGR